ncbi:hypothetical protein Sjap_024223 [Stephania japonica]|uniref:Uncharacterized protein n=1 Tax=Stephania japonica TaxID=461633 RepID=A0AAP0ED13_9MAGN
MRTRYWPESGDRFSYSQSDGNNQLAHRPYVPSRLSHQINSRFVQAIIDAHLYVSRVQEKSPYRGPDVAFSTVGPVVEFLGMRVCAPDEAVEGLEHFSPLNHSAGPNGPWLSPGAGLAPGQLVKGSVDPGQPVQGQSTLDRSTWLRGGGGSSSSPHRQPWRGAQAPLLDPDHHYPPSLPRDGGDLRRLARRSPPLWPAALEEKVKAEGWREPPLFLSVTVIEEYLLDLRSHAAAAAETTASATATAADLSSHAALTPANPYSLSLGQTGPWLSPGASLAPGQLVKGSVDPGQPPWRGAQAPLLDPNHHHPPSLPRDGGDLRRLARRSPPLWPAALEEKVKAEGWREPPLFLSVTVIEEYLLDLRSHAAAIFGNHRLRHCCRRRSLLPCGSYSGQSLLSFSCSSPFPVIAVLSLVSMPGKTSRGLRRYAMV